ncbi:MAG: hypothetical protein ACQETQ_05755 [Spirochaetota bacterium]
MTIPAYRQELDKHHDRLKENKEYDAKLEALREVAYYTAFYVSEVYKEHGLYDYRRIENLAEKTRKITDEDLETVRRYYEMGQVWRANIGLTSVGLDLFIVQSGVEQVMAESGKYPEELGDSAPGHPLISSLRKTVKPLLGHNKRNPDFSIDDLVRQVTENIQRL